MKYIYKSDSSGQLPTDAAFLVAFNLGRSDYRLAVVLRDL